MRGLAGPPISGRLRCWTANGIIKSRLSTRPATLVAEIGQPQSGTLASASIISASASRSAAISMSSRLSRGSRALSASWRHSAACLRKRSESSDMAAVMSKRPRRSCRFCSVASGSLRPAISLDACNHTVTGQFFSARYAHFARATPAASRAGGPACNPVRRAVFLPAGLMSAMGRKLPLGWYRHHRKPPQFESVKLAFNCPPIWPLDLFRCRGHIQNSLLLGFGQAAGAKTGNGEFNKPGLKLIFGSTGILAQFHSRA